LTGKKNNYRFHTTEIHQRRIAVATINGTSFSDALFGTINTDLLNGLAGNDILVGSVGNDTLNGGSGFDTADYSMLGGPISLRSQGIVSKGALGQDQIFEVERIVGAAGFNNLIDGSVSGQQSTSFQVNLEQQVLTINGIPGIGSTTFQVVNFVNVIGTKNGDIIVGDARSNFLAGGAGDDAINGGAGDDIIDGGTGSSFLTGGSGRDDFYIDARGGATTWSTITDWTASERLVVWGWNPGQSKVLLMVENAGAEGFKGATMHADIDGNGAIDTSVTFSGLSLSQVAAPLELDGLLWFI
jgi:serralysin